MKKTIFLIAFCAFVLFAEIIRASAQGCSACQGGGSRASQSDVGISFHFSMGWAQYGQSAGTLMFSSIAPGTNLYNPGILQFTAPTRTDVAVVPDANGIRQVNAPQALADINIINTNSYKIDFYYASQVGGLSGSTYSLSGSPYMTWTITNCNPATTNQIQISKISPSEGLLQQWTYSYDAASGSWTMQTLGGLIQENTSLVTLSSNSYQVVKTVQTTNGPVVRRTATTYQTYSWGAAPIEIDVGSSSNPQVTIMTNLDPGPGGIVSPPPVRSISRPDGSYVYNNTFDSSTGLPTDVISSYGDFSLSSGIGGAAKQVTYDYSTGSISGSGDDGTIATNIPRCTVTYLAGAEVGRSYTIFPSIDKRIDIQCATAGASWDKSLNPDNLYTTNTYYTNGANQFLLKSVVFPDKTMTTYDYKTNSAGTYQTNIMATGVPDSTFTYIVDGTTNYSVVNQFGQPVLNYSADIVSRIVLQQDTYGDFDGYGRPQQVSHLDGTTEYMTYSCCGLATTTDRDGTVTTFLYDTANRQTGYMRHGITYSNVLDAAGQVLQKLRIGTDSTTNFLSQSQYDLAGELIFRTNALNGVTTFLRTNDATTGGLIRVTTNADLGVTSNLYYLDGSLKQTYGTAARPVKYLLGVDGNSPFVTTVKFSASNGTNEWVKNYTDLLGRQSREIYAASSSAPYSISYYNLVGQLTNQIDPDGVSEIYVYNAKGEAIYSIVDSNQDGTIDWNGSDRVTFTTNDVMADGGVNVRRTRTYAFTTGGSYNSNLVSTAEYSVDGLSSANTVWNAGNPVTTRSVTVYAGSGYRYVTNIAPDNSYTVSAYLYGRLTSVTRNLPSGGQLSQTTYAYDAHGRQNTSTDARNGATTYYFNNADQPSGMKTPSPDGILSGQITSNYFDKMGRITNSVLPDGTSVTSEFYLTGDLKRTYGSRTYPVGYGYDAQGRMAKMTNWTSFATGAGVRVTSWAYDAYRGFLSGKTYNDGVTGPSYAYTNSGRLIQRTWARGVTTTYGYNGAGELSTVTYSDSTVGITNGYDRRGRLTIVSDGPTVCNMTYNDQNQILTESYTGGPLDQICLSNSYDNLLRRTNNTLSHSNILLVIATNNYDAASRLNFISDGTNSATYSYFTNSMLVSDIVFAQSGTTRMTTVKQYDFLNRVTLIYSSNSTVGLLDSHGYNYNNASQRTNVANTDNSQWNYQYDNLGQVISGKKYWSDGTPVAGEQFTYSFDDIGNRQSTAVGGDQWGFNLRWAAYSVDSSNQYTSRTVPGAVDIIGSATNNSTVTVNDQPSYRKGSYYRTQLPLNNSSSAVWQSVTNLAVLNQGTSPDLVTSNVGNVFLSQTPENLTYDADGNLTQDGRWNYYWDAENRLTNMTSLSTAPVGSKLKLDFGYDYKGRRVEKTVSTNSGTWIPGYTNRFVYDGWNLVAILDPASVITQSFVWGLDLNGSKRRAGGIGGLLETMVNKTNCFVTFDGSGNVSALVSAANGALLAQYEYGPFGEVIRATGPMARFNSICFSSKYKDTETALVYYGYRYYNSVLGAWLSRDPKGEKGGLNLFSFTGNNPVCRIDPLGRNFVEEFTTIFQYNDSRVPAGDGAITYEIKNIIRPTFVYCSCYGTKLTDFYMYTKIFEAFRMSQSDAFEDGSQLHEDAHAAAYRKKWVTIGGAYAVIYKKCLKPGCMDAWSDWKDALTAYAFAVEYLTNDQIDFDHPPSDITEERLAFDQKRVDSAASVLIDQAATMEQVCAHGGF